MAYGSKTAAEVIRDKFKSCIIDSNIDLSVLTEDEKNNLLTDIYNLCNITIKSDIHEYINAMKSISKLSMEKLTNIVDLDADNSIIDNSESKHETNENNEINDELKGEN